MEMLDVAIGGLFRSFFSCASGTEPDDVVLIVNPGDASKVQHMDSVRKGLVDAEGVLGKSG